ncbi:ribosome assembly protein METTL17, mitochondrial-like [Diadema antillarum]|uniref:ribosome assembly protein METTL17, mitochondrial-like n=1 Tax=Diadema antillarum TaxID=105358 RepID=UPI003A8A7A74
MAASMGGHAARPSMSYCKSCIQRRSSSTVPQEDFQTKVSDRTNWHLDTKVESHRHHVGVLQVKPVRLPEPLLTNINAVLQRQTIRNLVPEAAKLSNYLHSRKRPVEEAELRSAAKHLSEEIGMPDVDADEVSGQSLSPDTKKKMQNVMKILRQRLYRWQAIEYDDIRSLAYMIARMPANYAALYRVFNEIRHRDPDFQPKNILDFGSGVGTAVWAANRVWGEVIREYYLVEVSKSMNQLSEMLLRKEEGKDELHIPNVYFRYFTPVALRTKYSVTLSAYSLLELPSLNDRINTVRNLWRKTSDYMVLIESGNYESYLALMEVRDAILQEECGEPEGDLREEKSTDLQQPIQDRLIQDEEPVGGHVFAPCPHDMLCPRLQEQRGTPCNFTQTYHPLPQYVGPRASGLKTETFCYVVLKKGSRQTDASNWPRVVRPVLKKSRHVICRLCRPDGSLGEAVITKSKHSKDLYRCSRYTNWGDMLPVRPGDASPGKVLEDGDDEEENITQ